MQIRDNMLLITKLAHKMFSSVFKQGSKEEKKCVNVTTGRLNLKGRREIIHHESSTTTMKFIQITYCK